MLVEREVFFRGMVYIIEEEVYSDSDRSSVYTSEDDFEENDAMVGVWCQENPLVNENRIPEAEEEDEYYGEEGGEKGEKTK